MAQSPDLCITTKSLQENIMRSSTCALYYLAEHNISDVKKEIMHIRQLARNDIGSLNLKIKAILKSHHAKLQHLSKSMYNKDIQIEKLQKELNAKISHSTTPSAL